MPNRLPYTNRAPQAKRAVKAESPTPKKEGAQLDAGSRSMRKLTPQA